MQTRRSVVSIMINFVVVDDFQEITKKIEKIINKIMIKNKLEYKINIFSDYDDKFNKLVNSQVPNKIYFLDIETKSASGLDIARKIRKNDLESVIVFITAHDELSSLVVKDQLMTLTFICKFDDFENKVKEAAIKALEIVGTKKIIKFTDYGSLYTIPIKDILYVTRDSVERKCLIKTDYTTYKVGKNLSDIKEMSFGNLTQTHRGCLVNENRIQKIDKRHNEIVFDNGESITLLSNNYKKELV